MKPRRVVVTGIGLVCPLGHDLAQVTESLQQGRSGVVVKPEWHSDHGLDTQLAGEVRDLPLAGYPRKKVRGMGRVTMLALYATEQAVAQAGLTADEVSQPGVGMAYGSTHGSSSALIDFVEPLLANGSFRGIPSSSYLKFMSHTCVANLAQYYGIQGRIIPTAAACVSASLALGYGFETVRAGRQDIMLCGGAEELHFIHAGIFDIMMATSRRFNDSPAASPRPFDADRDGLVVGEGAATLVLESLDHAEQRGAPIFAEVVGFGTNCDGRHLTSPSARGMAAAMELALTDAGLAPEVLDYVNAHATGTDVGDIAESQAMAQVLGSSVPVSSTKGLTGHTLGACGTVEAAFCLAMMRHGFLVPNANLDRVDPRCAELHYLRGDVTEASVATVMTNNFAFGGINTSVILSQI